MKEHHLTISGIAGLNERAISIIERWRAKRSNRLLIDSCGHYHFREFIAPDGRVVVEEMQKLHNGYAFHALRDLQAGKFIQKSLWRKREMEAFPDEPMRAKRKITKRT